MAKKPERDKGLDKLQKQLAASARKLDAQQKTAAAQKQDDLPEFEDPLVQIVYKLLFSNEAPPDQEEHWEGWAARRIVAAITPRPAAPRG